MRFAVETLNSCHNQNDVELAFRRLPDGMEALYDRMALSVDQIPSPHDRALASNILQCVTCSLRVLKVTELSQALNDDASKVLDFQKSIVDLCHGFVVVDSGGNVAIIHQTAREYLLGDPDRPFQIDRHVANRRLFLSCIRILMITGLRAKIQSERRPDFLNYAAASWPSHLSFIPSNDRQVVEVLSNFLTGPWVLTWINYLALSKQLGVIVQASKHLTKYAAKQREYKAAQSESDHHIVRQKIFESWAIDMVKIVGKFGVVLRRNPESIYKLVPPFCPQNSIIYEQFGKAEVKSIAVSGMATDNWDDSLARVALDSFASAILAAGTHIAILTTNSGVNIYNSSTFEETPASPIKHGERVYRIDFNNAGTLLAIYGFKTTKVWEVSTGKRILNVSNSEKRPQPLTILFTKNNRQLLVGTDDRRIRSVNIDDRSPNWELVAYLDEEELEGHFLNAASRMALNSDGSLVAVAYRGHPLSAFEVDGPVRLGHCWRKQEEVARGQVIQLGWHPHSPVVFGLYIEGFLFKWSPYDGEIEELDVRASQLAISRDGSLLATGDVRGTVKVLTTSDLGLLYQLASEDTVLGLAFSPDLHRFYDIRGYYANAWEPDSLIRFAEQRGSNADSESEIASLSQSSSTSVAVSGRVDSVTALAASPMGRFYCCGTDKGVVRLYETKRGKIADIYISKGVMSIEHIAWSNDGGYICFSDTSRKIFVMSMKAGSDTSNLEVKMKAEISMKSNTKGPILQILFHPNSSWIAIHSNFRVHVISLESLSIMNELELPTAECEWIVHPQDPTFIVGVGHNVVHIVDWELANDHSFHIESVPQHGTNPEDSTRLDTVDRVLVTHDKKHIMVQMSSRGGKSKVKTLLYFNTSSLTASDSSIHEITATLRPEIIPSDLSSEIAISLHLLPNDRLVFLSRSYEICTWKLAAILGHIVSPPIIRPEGSSTLPAKWAADKHMKSLFPLPGDWISRDCLLLCNIWGIEKSLLCPRNGEVAVVRCAALF